ncbi:MAG TPA: hypothetical protein VF254_01515 [Gammaproteobacteria bacterium]
MDRINSVPGAQGHMELFYHSPPRRPPRAGRNDYPRFVEMRRGARPRAVFRYLDGLYSRPGAVGFKLMYPHIRQYPEILLYILRHRIAVIHLVRNNHLDVILSEHLANKTGRFHMVKEEGFEQKEVVSLDPATVAAGVRWLDRKQQIVRSALRAMPVPVHEISYESLCHDNSVFIGACDFIGIPGEREDREKSHLVKTQRSPHSKVIDNYQEVRSALTLAGYQHLLQ